MELTINLSTTVSDAITGYCISELAVVCGFSFNFEHHRFCSGKVIAIDRGLLRLPINETELGVEDDSKEHNQEDVV